MAASASTPAPHITLDTRHILRNRGSACHSASQSCTVYIFLPSSRGRANHSASMVRTARQLNVDWPITRHDHVDFATSARNGHRTIDGRVLLRPSSRVHEPCIWSGAVALTVTDGLDPIRVAVGTALAGGPPHRSQRAGLPHWAPTLGAWRRSAPAEWMHGAGLGYPPGHDAVHPGPGNPGSLAAAP